MNTLILGQSGSGKTTKMKEIISQTNKKVIILDFKNQYEDLHIPTYFLDHISPIIGEIGINEIKSINAGYVKDSHCLHKKGKELLDEYKVVSKEKLVEEVIERLYISWDNVEMAYAKFFSSKIPLRKNKNHISVNSALEQIMVHDKIILKGKSMHSDHIRAVAFSLISKISKEYSDEILIVCDDLSSFMNNGNLKLFFETIDFSKISFLVSFNKISNVPKSLIPHIDEYLIFRFDNKMDFREINILPIPFDTKIKKLGIGKFLSFSSEKVL